jgi:glutathione peroxidase
MFLSRVARVGGLFAALIAMVALTGATARAFPKFANKEGVACVHCHTMPGGPRNFRGLYYRTHNFSFSNFDETFEAKAAGVAVGSRGEDAVPKVSSYPDVRVPAVLNFVMKDIDGKNVHLGRFQGDVILMVNVASKCGNTPQYASLEKIYEKYKEKGFTILGFPANDFFHQEPGDNKTIKAFCTSTYKVAFPMFSKIVVKGENPAPLYKLLTDKKTYPKTGGDIDWNFAKFLINRKGEVVARFKAGEDPLNPEIIAAIEKELAAKTADTDDANN